MQINGSERPLVIRFQAGIDEGSNLGVRKVFFLRENSSSTYIHFCIILIELRWKEFDNKWRGV